MSKVEFTGKVSAEHMFFMDIPEQPKTLRGVWLAMVETTDKQRVAINDSETTSGLIEASTKEEAIEKAEAYLKKVTASDSLYEEAKQFVIQMQSCSVSKIQRRFRLGYTSAAKIVDRLEENKIVSQYNGSTPRKVLIKETK